MNSYRRVAITGVGLISPIGNTFEEAIKNSYSCKSSVVAIPEEAKRGGLATRVASIVQNFDEKALPRQMRRSMSRVSLMAVVATGNAIRSADLTTDQLQSERTGVSYSSTMGGTSALELCFKSFFENKNFSQGFLSTTFLQIMSHTCAANIITTYSIPGRAISSCTACSASTQSIGFGYEAIKYGLADRMICGGAEEFHVAVAGVFDVMRATSTAFNDTPSETPRPFSKNRDGIVVGEGAGTLILEEWEQAVKRGAKIYGEVVGFYTNADGSHMTNPSVKGMASVMCGALDNAGLNPGDVTYVNAHGTGTQVGDIAESKAIHDVFGGKVPVSSLKGHFGHLMGAAGVVETTICLGMLTDDCVVPTLHLNEVDSECAPLNYVQNETKPHLQKYVIKNSFAFGGINASLVLKKV